jgi:hypothetical protein
MTPEFAKKLQLETYKRHVPENKLPRGFTGEILVKESRVTDFFLMEFNGHATWETAEVIPSGSHDFTVHNGYLKQHKASPPWEGILKFNCIAKTCPSHKKEPTFQLT